MVPPWFRLAHVCPFSYTALDQATKHGRNAVESSAILYLIKVGFVKPAWDKELFNIPPSVSAFSHQVIYFPSLPSSPFSFLPSKLDQNTAGRGGRTRDNFSPLFSPANFSPFLLLPFPEEERKLEGGIPSPQSLPPTTTAIPQRKAAFGGSSPPPSSAQNLLVVFLGFSPSLPSVSSSHFLPFSSRRKTRDGRDRGKGVREGSHSYFMAGVKM